MLKSVSIALLVGAMLATSVAARQVENWPYDRLFNEADLVVMAAPQSTVQSEDPAPDGPWQTVLVGQRTTFSVIFTLKGGNNERSITVRHFRLKDGALAQDGPRLVSFRTEGPLIEGGRSVKYQVKLNTPQYLLFLKRSDDGCYEPVSGQIDAVLSVREIYSPLPEVMDRK